MARIMIDDFEDDDITEIGWINKEGNGEHIRLDTTTLEFDDPYIYLADIDKVIKALEKAKELWGDKA